MMAPAVPAAGAAVLLVAGLYQLTPFKQVCLRSCRAPIAFMTEHWRPGVAGAVRMGAVHGLYCLGCCWALMLVLFAGGVMNLTVIVALTVWVLVEKLAPFGEPSAAQPSRPRSTPASSWPGENGFWMKFCPSRRSSSWPAMSAL